MASKALKGLTVKIGADTTGLSKALDGIEKQSRSLSGELGEINKLLKLDPKNTELLAQKQKVLADAIGQTEQKLDTLREAEKQVQGQFERGEVSEAQYRALQREIIATEKKLDGYKKAAQETADAVDDLGKDTKTTGDKIDDMGDDAKDAEADVEGLGDTLETGLAVGLGAVAAAAVGAAAGIKSVVDETAEYRNAMGKLDTAFQSNGHSSQAATDTYKELQSVLGETDQAVEAAAFIAKLADNEEDLATWTNIATGVYGQFGASLPIEGLTEAANETAKVGQVTGPLADALNWAAQEGETFGVKMKEATEANEEWNKAVEEAKSAEDFFNLALQECSSEQERQALIMETLNSMYANAADQYRETNAEVIAQNQAAEKLNSAWAKVGEKAAPIVTTFTEGMAELVEAFFDLIEDVDIDPFLKKLRTGFQTVAKDVLPKLVKALEWCIDNFDLIKSVALGFITALAAKKVMTFATAISGTLTAALKKGTKGMEAMNATANANPYVLLATVIIGLTSAVVSYSKSAADAALEARELTKEEQELLDKSKEVSDSFRDQKEATDEALGNVTAEYKHLQDLVAELENLADASGKVKDEDQARADFIITELNKAYGLEIKMVDGVIQKYDALKASIDEVMLSQTAQSLLEVANESYTDAITSKTKAFNAMADAQAAVTEQQNLYQEALDKLAEWEERYSTVELGALSWSEKSDYLTELENRRLAVETELGFLNDKQQAYTDAQNAYFGYLDTIEIYRQASQASMEGDYQTTIDLLSRKGAAHVEFSSQLDAETNGQLAVLMQAAVEAGHKAELYKKNFENGVDGYTAEMVAEAEQGYQDALDEFATAYADAEAVGEDLSDGMTAGAENKRPNLLAKARSLVEGFLSAARKAADSHSPSRKAIAIFEDIGAGAEIGIDNKTKDVAAKATKQVRAVLDAYRAHEAEAQRSMQTIAARQVSNQIAYQTSAATANTPMLGKILAAIEKGQVILLDGDTVAGKTAGKTDAVLGARKILTDRSAL